MVWAIVVVAIAVLGVAAWAGTGRLGEMPDTVTDRPKAHIPDGPVDQTFMETVSLPVASTGYRRSQVDGALAAHAGGQPPDPEQRFDVVRRGYDMQAVDMILERMRPVAPFRARTVEAENDDAMTDLYQGPAAGLHSAAKDPQPDSALVEGDLEMPPDLVTDTEDSLHREGAQEGDRGEAAAP